MSTPTLPRNATVVHVDLLGRDCDDIERAVATAIHLATGDWTAKVELRCDDDGEGPWYIVVKQAHATFWTPLPETLAELIGDWRERFTLHWNDGEPPMAGEDE